MSVKRDYERDCERFSEELERMRDIRRGKKVWSDARGGYVDASRAIDMATEGGSGFCYQCQGYRAKAHFLETSHIPEISGKKAY